MDTTRWRRDELSGMRIDDGRLIHEAQAGDVACGDDESPHPNPSPTAAGGGRFSLHARAGFPLARLRERGLGGEGTHSLIPTQPPKSDRSALPQPTLPRHQQK